MTVSWKKPNDWGTEASDRSERISGKIKCQLLNNLAERENISYGEWMISKKTKKNNNNKQILLKIGK